MREQGLDDAIPDVARVHDAGFERLQDLRLEADLFMEADLEVGEQDQLCARIGSSLERARWSKCENAWRR